MAQADQASSTPSNVVRFPEAARPVPKASEVIWVDAAAFRELQAAVAALGSLMIAAERLGRS